MVGWAPKKPENPKKSASEIVMIGIVEEVDRIFCIFLCNSGDSFGSRPIKQAFHTLQRRARHITR